MLVHHWAFLSALCCFYMVTTAQGRPPNSQKRPNNGGGIVFPGFDSTTVRPIQVKSFVPIMEGEYPKCANGTTTFCVEDNSYPTEYVQNLIRNLESNLFVNHDELQIDVKDRLNENQYNLCESDEQISNPKTAKNREGKWKYIINQKEYYDQGVRVEICKQMNKPCGFVEASSGFVTSCEQKYSYRSLLSLDENGNPVSDSFILPSCCSCQLKRVDPSERIGLVRPNTTPAVTRFQATEY